MSGPRERENGLVGFRRYTWWSLSGTLVFFVAVTTGGWTLDRAAPGWARALSAAALTVLITAIVTSFRLRLTTTPQSGRSHGSRPPAVPAQATGPQAVPTQATGTQGGRTQAGPARATGSWGGRVPVGWLVAGCGAAGVLGVVAPVVGELRAWALAPAAMVAVVATFLPVPGRRVLVAAAVVVAGVVGGVVGFVSGEVEGASAVFVPVGLVAISSWLTLGMLWGWDVAERLNAAGRLAAELAVKEERLRFAADLHDIQGHHLQVIALKSELAARLAEADPARAAAEMREVQRLAAEALRDTRAVAQGYRRTTLEEEIANAAKVLAAAEIRTSVEGTEGSAQNLSETGRHLLGLVMREATTNVLRHSKATHARIAYRVENGRALLHIGNDGTSGAPSQDPGTGLPVLAERLRNAEGTLEWRSEDDWFEVTASLPTDTAGAA